MLTKSSPMASVAKPTVGAAAGGHYRYALRGHYVYGRQVEMSLSERFGCGVFMAIIAIDGELGTISPPQA